MRRSRWRGAKRRRRKIKRMRTGRETRVATTITIVCSPIASPRRTRTSKNFSAARRSCRPSCGTGGREAVATIAGLTGVTAMAGAARAPTEAGRGTERGDAAPITVTTVSTRTDAATPTHTDEGVPWQRPGCPPAPPRPSPDPRHHPRVFLASSHQHPTLIPMVPPTPAPSLLPLNSWA